MIREQMVAILPCSDLDAAEAFFARLGFDRAPGSGDEYRMLSDGQGAELHLRAATAELQGLASNPFGLYLFRRDVDAAAAAFAGEIIGAAGPRDTPWDTYEFALNGPDGVLVRVGWPLEG